MLNPDSYEGRVMLDSITGGITHELFSKSSESLGNKNYSESKTKELRKIIYEKITRKNHKYKSPEKGDGTLKKCISLFKENANPNVLIELEKSLSKRIESEKSLKKKEEYQKHYKYYIENFLPALKVEVIESKELAKPSVLNNEGKSLQRSPTIRGKIIEIILGITNKSSSKDYSSSTIQNQSSRRSGQVDRQDNTNTPKFNNGSDSGIDSPETSAENLELPVSSRRNSSTSVTSTFFEENLNSTLSSISEDQMHPEQAAPEESQVSFQHVTLESMEKWIPVSSTGMTSNLWKSGEKNYTENILPVNEKKGEVEQPNNRNLHIALAAGCALLAVGCIVVGAMTSGLVGAGLFAISAVFATAAAAELHSSFLSSKLTSINVSLFIDSRQHGKS